MKDIIFCSIPYLELHQIYSAPAVLKGAVKANGFTAQTVDFGVELFKICDSSQPDFYKIQNFFISANNGGLNNKQLQTLGVFFDNAIATIKQTPSKYVGISILSNFSHKCALILLNRIKDECPDRKIILGGRGVDVPTLSTIVDEFKLSSIEKMLTFKELVKKRKLADIVVSGDGEDAIVHILKTGTYNTQSLNESDYYHQSNPDYLDYEFKYYTFEDGNLALPITGSKGCVRNCDFCDVPRNFGKYRYRPGADIAREMIALQKEYGVNHFIFTDSLVNGGLRPFTEFLQTIANFNKTAKHKISWSGQYINRPPVTNNDDYYQLLKESGAKGLTIGAESGSNYVLKAINKKTDVESLFYDLEKFREHDITCNILTFIGHWSEREEDFQLHCDFLVKLAPYVRSGTISILSLGYPFLLTNPDIVKDGKVTVGPSNKDLVWLNSSNPSNTFKERVYRRLLVGEIAKRLQLPVRNNALVYQYLATTIEHSYPEINSFYKGMPDAPSKKLFEDFDEFYIKLLSRNEKTLDCSITISAFRCNSDPAVVVKANNIIVLDQLLTQGQHTFNFAVAPTDNNVFEISLTNKHNDTQVNNNGTIVADKYIVINNFKIQNFSILDDCDFYQTYAEYLTTTHHNIPLNGLWENGTIRLSFSSPFVNDYCSRSTKNVLSSGQMKELSERDYQTELKLLLTKLRLLE